MVNIQISRRITEHCIAVVGYQSADVTQLLLLKETEKVRDKKEPWQILRSVYQWSADHTNNGIAVHHSSPPKCALTRISFSCRQWTPPSETYRESRRDIFCSRGRAPAQGNRRYLSSRTEQSNLSRLCSFPDENSTRHVEPSPGGLPTQPRLPYAS